MCVCPPPGEEANEQRNEQKSNARSKVLRSSVPVRPVLVEAKTMKPSAKLANAPLLPVALNSPAAKVKEGRERGPSVLETLRKQEEAQELAAKTAKRSKKKQPRPTPAVTDGVG